MIILETTVYHSQARDNIASSVKLIVRKYKDQHN